MALAATAWAPGAARGAGPFDTFTVPPCRVLDTRPTTGPIGAHRSRSIVVAGALTGSGQGGAADCGVPAGIATGVFITVVAVDARANGHLTLYPFNAALPLASSLNFQTGQTVANSILVPICVGTAVECPYDLTLTMGPGAADIVLDVTGYLAPVAP
jgi:hypothetical protein